jgi:hypothetical protein
MKNGMILSLFVLTALLPAGCAENFDPLSPGSTDGQYAMGMKSLVPLAVGNSWTYRVQLYDTSSGAAKAQYSYTLIVIDTVTTDTSLVPLVPPGTDRKALKREALIWYLLQGESGVTTCWQVDSVENLRTRKSDDTRFYEQSAFSFRASPGDATPLRYIGKDTTLWASGDRFIHDADSVKSTLVSKGVDTLRTTLGSAPWFKYRQSYVVRTGYTDFYFKPGFGLFLVEQYQQNASGTMVRVRRDELASYYFK